MTSMTPTRFRQIRNLFEAVLEQPPTERESFLRDACQGDDQLRAEVVRLLEARDNGPSWLDEPPAPARTDPRSLEGRLIGPYQILRELGQGGMGVVYLAERADHAFHKQVAIKIVHAGLASAELIARFEQEREILASLDHANIARLLDGGTTPDGLSYLVMEYVDGRPIDSYCDDQKLDITARLELFRTVCSAVEYAHTRRVIHRDLKPANILVTADGTVKLLDFGIAKLMPDRAQEATGLITRTGLMLMTPEFASPEQVKGEPAGAAADVYALGVVLYELLTGRLPYRLRSRIFHEVVRVVSEEPPIRPSTAISQPAADITAPTTAQISRLRQTSPSDLSRRLSGDLDGIILKTLEKDPRDRYRTPAALSDDIQRHIERRPVEARQASPGYRAGKFIGRNLPWAILGAALIVMISTGGITIHWTGAAVIVGCLLAVGVWYAATNRSVGRRIAESEFLFTYVPPRAVLISMVGMIIQKPFVMIYAALSPILIRQAIGWLTRKRTAGALVLDLSPSPRWAMPVLFGMIVASRLLNQVGSRFFLPPFYFYFGYLAAGIAVWLNARLEFRSRGIVYYGSLYTWENIESYAWRDDPHNQPLIQLKIYTLRGHEPILYLRLRRRVQFLPPVRVPIPEGRREEVDEIMRRYLSEWPGSPEVIPTL